MRFPPKVLVLDHDLPWNIPSDPTPPIRPQGTYLITGGYGGFGLALAEWLVSLGATHLVLLGRHGATSASSRQGVATLRAKCSVVEWKGDVASRPDLVALFDHIDRHLPPLRGIFHAAAVLDDAPISSLTDAHLSRVMRPKALGAWHLHVLTKDRHLDHFVLFSSLTSQIGAPGQGAYVAANTYLDALAAYRRSAGLRGTAINWGAIGEVGMVTRYEEVAQYFERVGIHSMAPARALSLLERVLTLELSVGIASVDWSAWGSFNPAWARSPRYAHLMESTVVPTGESGILASLLQLDDQARAQEVFRLLAAEIAGVLRISQERVDEKRSLTQLGMDSLLAMELQVKIHDRFGIRISTLELLK
jgi:NAD(P)-dependent dehydrogenase (short-subunit alcohol dehydrogenase family)/acyl carrier protein